MLGKFLKRIIKSKSKTDAKSNASEARNAVRDNKLKDLHIPHSSVFYVRAAIEAKTGIRYTLKHVENAMKHEGMLDDV